MHRAYRIPAIVFVIFISAIMCAPSRSTLALPPFIPLETRVREADIIIIGDIIKVRNQKLNSASSAAGIRIRSVETLKGDSPGKEFSVSFLVFPGSYEDQLRKPPAKGRYFLFLKKKKVRDAQGKEGVVPVLYRPHPFSYAIHNKENLQRLKQLIALDKIRRSEIEAGSRK